CLLGVRCNHLGGASPSREAMRLNDRFRVIPVCPETMGGLPTPRPAAECQPDGRVVNGAGDDVTAFYERGARATVELAAVTGARVRRRRLRRARRLRRLLELRRPTPPPRRCLWARAPATHSRPACPHGVPLRRPRRAPGGWLAGVRSRAPPRRRGRERHCRRR